MLHLAVFTFLRCAVYNAMGLPDPVFPSLSSEGSRLNPDWYIAGPVIPDSEPTFGFGAKDKALPFLKNPSVSSKPSELQLSGWRSQTGKNGPPVIEQFANNFEERVKASKKLREAFQVHQFNAKSLSSVCNDYIVDCVSSIGALDAPVTARVFSDAVANNFHKLKEDDLLRIYANAIADYLYFRGCLNPSNAESLAQEYFTFTERRINSVKNPTPELNIRAIADAVTDLLTSQGLFHPHSTVRISEVFSNRFYEF